MKLYICTRRNVGTTSRTHNNAIYHRKQQLRRVIGPAHTGGGRRLFAFSRIDQHDQHGAGFHSGDAVGNKILFIYG